MTTRPRTAASSEARPRTLPDEPQELVGNLLLGDLGRAADEPPPAPHGAHEGAVLVEIRVEMALPVVPELVGVRIERRHPDVGAGERGLGLARVELRRVVDVGEDRARDPEVAEDAIGDDVARRQRRDRLHEGRREVDDGGREPDRGLRGVPGLGEDVDHLTRGLGIGVGQVEGPPVEPLDVGDVVHRSSDEVDRDEVDLPPLDAGHRHPLRHRAAQPADQLEEVVRAVDLVHLAGLGVADDDAGPVDAPRPRALRADDALGVVLGPEIGMVVEVLGLLEHVLPPDALVQACGGDRADHVHAPGLDVLRELDHVAGSLDVGDVLARRVGGHVVDGREVEEMVDLAPQSLDVLVRDAQAGLREVADNAHDAVGVDSPAVAKLLEPALRPLADQHVDRALPLEQELHQVASDEAGCAGDEVAHFLSSAVTKRAYTPINMKSTSQSRSQRAPR